MFSEFSEFGFRHENGVRLYCAHLERKLAVEFFTTDAPNASLLTQNSCLARFRSFGSGMKTVRKSAARAVLTSFGAEKLTVDVFTMDAPNRTLLTQNSCLARF